MNNRPTPETDALRKSIDSGANAEAEMTAFARKLERERDEALMDRANGDIATMTRNHYERILQERDEARERIERQKLEINRLNGATNHAGGTPLKIAWRERDELAAMCDRYKQERDEAREAFKIVYNERVQMELERNEWKNKAYSHATDYTLMEAKCFRLEQQLKEYDKLKS